MKKLAIFCATAVLVMSLVACGCQANRPNGNNATGSGNTDSSLGNSGSNVGNDLHNAAGDVGNAVGDVGNAIGDAVEDVLPGTTQNGTANSGSNMTNGSNSGSVGNNANPTGFQRMLENARVHDSDGDLTDGENSQW